MKRMTRTTFLSTGVASAGAAAGLVPSPAAADAMIALDATYRRSEVPRASVAYPSTWHLYPKLITDVTAPAELFSISSEALTPGPSVDQSGLPDVSALGATGILITIFAQRLGHNGAFSGGQPISAGIGIDSLTKKTQAGVDERTGWFLAPEVGYLVFVWSGQGNAPLATADGVLRSFRPA
jgi:hypothetical protein